MAGSLINLGITALRLGDLAAARDYCLRGLAMLEQRAPGSRNMANGFSTLGGVARLQGDLAAARGYYQRSLAIRE
jgi:Tfp pilus assembly protein PilF